MNTIKNSDFKILAVDDEPDLLQISEFVLRKEKYHIETALNGEDCMRAIRQDKPDLLLLDVMLPDINGIVLCEKIKNDPELSSIFIILLSGSKIDSDNISEGLETGADGYLIKPVKNRELVARVEAAVRIIHTKKVLRESEDKFRTLIMTSSDIVYRMSPDWKEMYALDGRNFMVTTTKPNATWFEEYIPPEDQELVMFVIQEAIRTKSVFALEHMVWLIDGTIGWALSRAIPRFDENGEIFEWFGAASDDTERKQAEEKLKENYELLRIAEEKAKQGE